MSMQKQIVPAVRMAGLFGVFVLTGMAQQRGGGPVVPPSTQQALAIMAQQQAQQQLQMSQSSSPPLGTRAGQSNAPFPQAQSEESSPYVQDQVRLKRNDERQRRLESDTGRLLALANLLKLEVAASGSESMTPEMVRQMDEIEKLARSVKDRMRN